MPTPHAPEDVAFGRIDEVLHTAAATIEILLNTREATNALNFADRLWSLYLEPGWLEVLGANEHGRGVTFRTLRSFAAARAARSTEPVSAFRTAAPSFAALALTFAQDVDHFVRDALADVNGLISSVAEDVDADAGASAAKDAETRIIAALDAHLLADKRTRRFIERTLLQARVDAARLFGIEYDECAAEPGRWHVGFRAEVARIASGVALELDAIKHDAAARRNGESDDGGAEGEDNGDTVSSHEFGPYHFKAGRDGNLCFTGGRQEGNDDHGDEPVSSQTDGASPSRMSKHARAELLAASPTDRLDDLAREPDAMLTYTALASRLMLAPEPLRKRLDRFRAKNGDGWEEVADARARQTRYLYRVGAVLPILRDALGKTSGETSG